MSTWDGFAPLHYASSKDTHISDQLRIIDALLKAGADVTARNDAGWAPVHYAVEAGNLEVVARFLQAGADVKTNNPAGFLTECHRRAWPAVLRAGCPAPDLALRLPRSLLRPHLPPQISGDLVEDLRYKKPGTFRYLARVGAYSTFDAYAKARLDKLAATFAPKLNMVPEELVPTIMGFYAHAGCY